MNFDYGSGSAPADHTVIPVALTTGGDEASGFVGDARPSLYWKLEARRPDVLQQAYQVEIARDAGFSDILVRSEALASAQLLASEWPAVPLVSRQVCWARVRVWTDAGLTAWSEPLRIEAALLGPEDWQARPVSALSNCGKSDPGPVPLMRGTFHIDKPVAQARLYVTALGIHDSSLNGLPLSDAQLEPGWTAYEERLLYAAYDVTDRLAEGENVLAAAVGDGWWRGWLTWMERRAIYGATTAYLAQLEVAYVDGSHETFGTDETWRGGFGGLVAADLYNGCTRDLRAEPDGWRDPGFDDAEWEPVSTLALPKGLELRAMPPVRIVEAWSVPAAQAGLGKWLIDTGQNLAGYLRLRVRGQAGMQVTVRHAEVLDDDGTLYTAPLRNAEATDRYILADDAVVTLEPSFTFHGFRYAEILADDDLVVEKVEVCALSSDLAQTGRFACSDTRLDKLFSNVRWSQLGNFVALPTDCPQRDERLGWTGDIQVFADTACLNAAAGPFLASWLKDLAIEQREDGYVPSTVPNVIRGHEFEYGGVGWGDAGSLVPWSVYCATGDAQVLRDQFESIRRWVDFGASRRDADGLWTQDFHLGDWLDPGAPADEPEKATTEANFIATAYLSHSASILARAARVVGRGDLVAGYEDLADDVAKAAWRHWRDHLVTTQAGCAIALEFGIVPPEDRTVVGAALAGLVERSEGRIATGFLGTPMILPALSATGHIDAAYSVLMNEACPGWLYQVKRGATTMWERWDAVKEDGTLHAGEMSSGGGSSMISFNHYAYGAVAAWLYRTVAGIATDDDTPGYAMIRFAPRPGGGLRWANASLDTPYGRSAIAWDLGEEGVLALDLDVAPGARGLLDPPPGWALPAGGKTLELGSGRHRLRLRAN